jgi:hypothetical protein
VQSIESDPQDVLLKERDLAERWGCHPNTLTNQRGTGRGVPFVRLGPRMIRYRLSDVLAWESAQGGSQ